jgi:tetratricopeptide (TPR) repeat protein
MDPHNAHATATRGMLRMMCEMDWRSALEDLEQAGIQAPHSSWVLQARGLAYAAMGRHDESIGIGSRMLDLAPDSLFEWMAAGFVRIYAGKYEESLSFLERSARIEPGNVWPKLELIFALNRLGRIEEARKLWLQARTMSPPREDIMKDVWVTEFEAAAGYRDDILETIRHWESRSESVYIAPLKIAELYAGVKDADQTMKWLEKAFQERSALLFWVNSDPVFDFLRGDPRFKDFGRRAGLPKVAGGG